MSQVVNQETAEIIEAKTEPLENEENMQEQPAKFNSHLGFTIYSILI